MRAVRVHVRQNSALWPGAVSVTLAVEAFGRVAPGQFVLAAASCHGGHVLPVPLLPWAQDEEGGSLQALLFERDPVTAALSALNGTQEVVLVGPAGRGFTVDQRTRRAVVLADGPGLGASLLLTAELLGRGVEVVFIGGQAFGQVMPASLLPPEVEFLAPGAVTPRGAGLEALAELATWSDQLFISTEMALLEPITAVLRRRLLRMKRGYAQALLPPLHLPCGVGACDLCTIRTRDGYRRLCRDGLVFDLLQLL